MPPNRCAPGFSLSATAVLLAACSGGDKASSQAARTAPETTKSPMETAFTAEGRQILGCPRIRPVWRRPLPPPDFLPPSLAGLRLRQNRCVYLVFPRREDARPLWRTPAGERVSGLSWAPGGKMFALTTESRHPKNGTR